MKIGLVLSTSPAYSETFFNSKIKGLQSNGFDVVLFTQVTNADFKLCKVVTAPKMYTSIILQYLNMFMVLISLIPKSSNIIRYIFLERKENTSWFNLIKKIYLNTHILKSDVDCLHFGFATQALGSEHVAKAIKAKMAVSFRGFDINVYPIKHPKCYNLLWKHVDAVHSISKYLLDKAHDLGLSKTTPAMLITPAVDCEKLSSAPIVQKDGSKLRILTIARLHWIKGIDLLIETAALLKENKISFTWKLIGDGDQKSLERYKFNIYERGLQDEIILLGKHSHEQTLFELKQTHLYVQSSINEGFCNAVLEAQSLGKLCIATDVGGLSENIIDAKTGWLVPNNDAKAMALKISEVMMLSEVEKTDIETAAVLRVKSQFTIEQQQEQFVKFYNDICKK